VSLREFLNDRKILFAKHHEGFVTFVMLDTLTYTTAPQQHAEFINKGAYALGVGSSLANQPQLDAGELEELTRRAGAFIREMKKVAPTCLSDVHDRTAPMLVRELSAHAWNHFLSELSNHVDLGLRSNRDGVNRYAIHANRR